MLNIINDLEYRYLTVEKNTSEMVLLTKMVEEAGEFIGEVSGVICERTGEKVGSWKGKDKNYRQEMLHEWMDLYRLMYVWLINNATEDEKAEMYKLNEEKIRKLVERKESLGDTNNSSSSPKLVSAIEKLFEDYRLSDHEIAEMFNVDRNFVSTIRERFILSPPDSDSVGTGMSNRTLAWVCYNLILTRRSQTEIGKDIGLSQDKISMIQCGKLYRPQLIEMGFAEEDGPTEMQKARPRAR